MLPGRLTASPIAEQPPPSIVKDSMPDPADSTPQAGAELPEHLVYGCIGEEGFGRICRAFYEQVPGDDILGPMYPPDDMEGAEQRLRDFLIYRFGGPDTYINQRGHPRLRARHMPFAITPSAAERWLELMSRALTTAEIDPRAKLTLERFFQHMAHFLVNRPVP